MLGRLFQTRQEPVEPSVNTLSGTGLHRRLSSLAFGTTVVSPSQCYPSTASPKSASSVSPPKEQRSNSTTASQNPALSSVPVPNYTNEDSQSRTVLYGTPNHLRSIRLEQFQFRLLVVQDKGELLHKNNYRTCFDSANDHHFDKAGSHRLENRHSTDELIEFMFGNPIHQDFAAGDRCKIHQLSSLKDLPSAVLISKHFKVNKKTFSIAFVIPVSLPNFNEAVISNWSHISAHLTLIKSTFVENHVEKRNPAVAQNYLDVAILFKQLITSVTNLVTIPRLLLGLTQASDAMFNHWCHEVTNWIELKDGARSGQQGTRFLPTLLTVVNSVKNQLVNREQYSDESVRIVIMAANPIVAQKLIFILSAILPYKLNFEIDDCSSPDSKLTVQTDFLDDRNYPDAIPENKLTPPTPSVINKGWEIPTTPSRSIATPSLMTPTRSSVIQPLSTSQSMAYLSSSLQSHSSFSNSLSRGFSYLQNWKTSLESNSSSNSSSTQLPYRSPSPGIEYDEYPWGSYTTSATTPTYTTSIPPQPPLSSTPHSQPIPFTNPLPRSFSTYELAGAAKVKKPTSVPKLPHVDRSTTTIYSIGANRQTCDQSLSTARVSCHTLMKGGNIDLSYDLDDTKNVSILNVSFEDDDDDDDIFGQTTTKTSQTPPPLCGYVNEFIPEFQLQACPISADLESKIGTAMKSDLHHFANSRTILVSLRAREIREFVMSKGEKEVRTSVRRLYYNFKPSSTVDRGCLAKVETALEALLNGKDIKDLVRDW